MTIRVDYAISKNCKNLLESYGEICVKCNKCHRFNPNWCCINCGKRTRGMKSHLTWKTIELYDVFRAPVCPDCQKFFTDAELGEDDKNGYPDTIRMYRKNFKRRVIASVST